MSSIATSIGMTTADEPDGAPRLASLDILRGIAILGILFMNINDMGASITASFGDVRHLGWTTVDQVAYWLRAVLADGTARGLLEMLFGVGMAILTDRAATALGEHPAPNGWKGAAGYALFGPRAIMRPYYRRNLVLFGFGLIHVFVLLWPGDILHTYGIAALVAFLFHRLRPRWLVVLGLTGAMVQLVFGGLSYLDVREARAAATQVAAMRAAGQTPPPVLQKKADERAKSRADRLKEIAKDVAVEDAGRTGTTAAWIVTQWRSFLDFQRDLVEPIVIWEAAGTMLLGAALYRWGVIQGRRSRRFYLLMLVGSYAIGLTARAVGTAQQTRFDGSGSILWPLYEFARLATTLGHIAVIQLLLTTGIGAWLLRPFAAAGRTALSIYIGQTLICLWLLYPPFGLALYGKQGWMALMLTALGINAVLLLWANWYVRHYRIAPVEWAWRSIIAGRRLPFRKGTTPPPIGSPVPA